MTDIQRYRQIAYLLICAGVFVALLTAVLPHYDQSHKLALDIFLLGLLPYALYSLFTVLSMRVLLVISGIVILGLDLFVKLPGWWGMQTREVAEPLYMVPIISSCVVIPLTLLVYWIGRATHKTG